MIVPRLQIARWDLDKTYLRTEFSSLGSLFRTAIERPDRKRSVPGAAALLRELWRMGTRLHIVSGSPKQLGRKIKEKLALDGVSYSELTLKPNLQNLLHLRFRALKDQVGYKLPALLEARVRDQKRARSLTEVLSGDDAEADAIVYSLYADILNGRVSRETLRTVLENGRVFPDQLKRALAAHDALLPLEAPGRILIHLDRQTAPSHFAGYSPRLIPFYNYQQAAYVLLEDGSLDAKGTLGVAQSLMIYHQFDVDSLARSYRELGRRAHARYTAGDELVLAARNLPAQEPRYRELNQLAEVIQSERKVQGGGAGAMNAGSLAVGAVLPATAYETPDYAQLVLQSRAPAERRGLYRLLGRGWRDF